MQSRRADGAERGVRGAGWQHARVCACAARQCVAEARLAGSTRARRSSSRSAATTTSRLRRWTLARCTVHHDGTAVLLHAARRRRAAWTAGLHPDADPGDCFVKAHCAAASAGDPRRLLKARKRAKADLKRRTRLCGRSWTGGSWRSGEARLRTGSRAPGGQAAVPRDQQLCLRSGGRLVELAFHCARGGRYALTRRSGDALCDAAQMIQQTKDMVEGGTISHRYAHNAEVIYGDTDSIMVVRRVGSLAAHIARHVLTRGAGSARRPAERWSWAGRRRRLSPSDSSGRSSSSSRR